MGVTMVTCIDVIVMIEDKIRINLFSRGWGWVGVLILS